MRLGFFSKLATVWVGGCICLMFASLAIAQDGDTQSTTPVTKEVTFDKPPYLGNAFRNNWADQNLSLIHI